MKIKKVIEGGDTKAQILTQVINFGIIPFIAFALGRLFFQEQPYMALGLLMAGLVPTSGMTISWTGFAKGNVAAAVKMTVIGLTLGSLATPFYVRALMGAALEVDIAAVMKQQERWSKRFPNVLWQQKKRLCRLETLRNVSLKRPPPAITTW